MADLRYKVVSWHEVHGDRSDTHRSPAEKIEAYLNRMDAEGWDAVAVGTNYVFRRRSSSDIPTEYVLWLMGAIQERISRDKYKRGMLHTTEEERAELDAGIKTGEDLLKLMEDRRGN